MGTLWQRFEIDVYRCVSNFNLNEMAPFKGLSKNGRGSCGAGGEVAPVDVAKWRVFKGFSKMEKLPRSG